MNCVPHEPQLHSNHRGSNPWPISRILGSGPRVRRTAKKPARPPQNAKAARRLKGTNCPSWNWEKFRAEHCWIRARADKFAAARVEHDLFRKPVPTPDQVRGRPFRDHALTRERSTVSYTLDQFAAECHRILAADS